MKGWAAHRRAVETLRSSFAAIPAGATVRLAKRTSNLFRPRGSVDAPGLDVSGLDGVIAIDPQARTAEVQGMCTYEDLVDETLKFGLVPHVVPQLRTITLGGAVTGLGIESTSLRLGLPHESVREMDILTGAGELVTARPADADEPAHPELFDAFANSYGSLGYAVRLQIELAPAPQRVRLRHVRFNNAQELIEAIETVAETGMYEGTPVDAIDGTVFAPDEAYLTLAEFTDGDEPTSNYTGQEIYFESIRTKATDSLTMYDYLWRWDTDWFWCSGAFGAQHPVVRRLWPSRWRRSDVFHRLVGLDRRFGIIEKVDRVKKISGRERVIQDIEVPLDRMAEFLAWFDDEIGMRPVWLCPLRTRRAWPSYPLEPGRIYVNVGFWGTVVVPADSPKGALNRRIEAKVSSLGGHKSLYSEAFYSRADFDALYGTANLDRLREQYDPDSRLLSLFQKAVNNS